MSEKQTTLPLVSDDTLPDAPHTAIAVVADDLIEPRHGALADLRQHAMSVPSEVMQHALAEYRDRRKTFREWLKSQLVEGVHFGYPPTCEPRFDEYGNSIVKGRAISPKQWTHKPSIYKAGGEFVCDLMQVRADFTADVDAWKQLGSPDGTFVICCKLVSRANGEVLGEGRGVRRVGDKGGDANNAIKMAKKCAQVDAVLTTYGLSDLFTQDIEDEPQPPHDNPTPREDAPKVKPRGERGSDAAVRKQVTSLLESWKLHRPLKEQTPDQWAAWVAEKTGDTFNVRDPAQWTADCLMKVAKAIDAEAGYVE